LPNILKHTLKARLVIAIIDGRNPNVFYELGIAHALNIQTLSYFRIYKVSKPMIL